MQDNKVRYVGRRSFVPINVRSSTVAGARTDVRNSGRSARSARSGNISARSSGHNMSLSTKNIALLGEYGPSLPATPVVSEQKPWHYRSEIPASRRAGYYSGSSTKWQEVVQCPFVHINQHVLNFDPTVDALYAATVLSTNHEEEENVQSKPVIVCASDGIKLNERNQISVLAGGTFVVRVTSHATERPSVRIKDGGSVLLLVEKITNLMR